MGQVAKGHLACPQELVANGPAFAAVVDGILNKKAPGEKPGACIE